MVGGHSQRSEDLAVSEEEGFLAGGGEEWNARRSGEWMVRAGCEWY